MAITIIDKLATDERFKGPPGPKGDAGPLGEPGPAGPPGKDAAVDQDAIVAAVLAKIDYDQIAARIKPPQASSEQHMVVVAVRSASYWSRLSGEIKAAQEAYGGIDVVSPPPGFVGPLPQVVLYESGVPRVIAVGQNQVSTTLQRIVRGESL